MIRYGRIRSAALLAVLLPMAAGAQDSPLFVGTTADMWLFDPDTGQVTGYDTGKWMTTVNPLDYPSISFGDTAAFLINHLANSSVAMTPGQPVISLAGIGGKALAAGEGGEGGHRNLVIEPGGGDFEDTVAIRVGVSSDLLADGPLQLTYEAVETESTTTVVFEDVALARYAGGTGENGYYYETFYLVNRGTYTVKATLSGGAVNESETGNFTLVIPAGQERRDGDGDGIPDAVEIDMGLNPLENDWNSDLDGDGWSEFDEWLRRFCLDPATGLPIEGDSSCLDSDGLPLDSDNDDWSDFDEILRGTNPLDPEPVLVEQTAAPAANQKLGPQQPALAPSSTQGALFCTDGSRFYFDVRFYAEADWTNPDSPSDIIFGVGADNFAYQAPVESIRVNFDENGNITRRSPIVSSASSDTEDPRDRWLDGPIDDFTIEEGDAFNWHVYGSVVVGTDPLLAGDIVESVAIRSGLSGNSYTGNYTVSGDVGDCLVDAPEPGFTEYEARQRLRFKDYPAASRLYEIEHTVAPAAGILSVPPAADLLPDRQAAGPNDTGYAGIVVQSFTPAQDNIAGIDIRIRANPETEIAREDIHFNIWSGSPRDGELLLATTLRDVAVDGDPARPLAVRFEPVAVQPGQPVYFEFRKRAITLAASGADTLAGGGVIEIDGDAAAGDTDLVFDVYYDSEFANGVGGTRDGFRWWTVGAADLEGRPAYDPSLLLSDAEITAAGLTVGEIAPRRRMPLLQGALDSGQLPEMRLPAGDSVVVSAVHRHRSTLAADAGYRPPADYSRVYKAWLPRRDDLSPASMLAELGQGAWTTPDEWRREFIAYLAPRLVVPVSPTLDESSTLAVAVIEAALTEEARLDGSGGFGVLSEVFQPGRPIYEFQPGQPIYGDLFAGQSPYVSAWEDNLERLADGAFNLDQSFQDATAALAGGQPLDAVGQWLRGHFYAGVPGTSSDAYMAQQLMIAFPDVCKVPDEDAAARQADAEGWNEFLDQCPAWYDDTESAQLLGDMRERRYRLRLSLLPGAISRIAADATLLERPTDSDADGAINSDEIELPIRELTLPWLFDSDGDSIADHVDDCPNDPYNDCSASPIRPNVSLGADFAVDEPGTGTGFALVPLRIDRLYDVPVTVCYEAIVDLGDTATAGADFEAVSGCVTIEPGQLSALIEIPINADGETDSAETFTVTITSVTNGQVADDGTVVVTINDTVAINSPPVFTSATSVSVQEGSTATGYTATATDPDLDPLVYSISGGADQAAFAIDAATGVLSFVSAPVFASPADADGNNVYEVELGVSDGNGGEDGLALSVTVTEVVTPDILLAVTYPTPGANLGGYASSTTVAGRIIDPAGDPIDPAEIDYIDVGGVLATLDAADASRWSAVVPVGLGDLSIPVTLGRADGSTGNYTVEIRNFRIIDGFEDVALDTPNGRAFAINSFDGVYAIDLATGEREAISTSDTGSGPTLDSPRDVAVDAANGRLLVTDSRLDALFAVDIATGARTIIADGSTGTGVFLDGPQSVTLDSSANIAYVGTSNISNDLVVAVDLATGNRTNVSGAGLGSGPTLEGLSDIVLDAANGRILLVDRGIDELISVDIATGDRTTVSSRTTGSGIFFVTPEAVAVDSANNRALVADTVRGLLAVDLATGNRTVVTSPSADYGPNGTSVYGVDYDPAAGLAFITDNVVDVLWEVDVGAGTRSVVTGNAAGTVDDMAVLVGIQGIAWDPVAGRVLFNDSYKKVLWSFDTSAGHRTAVSSNTLGAGPIVDFPGKLAVDIVDNQAWFVEKNRDALTRADLVTGDRVDVSGSATGSGPAFDGIIDVALDLAGGRGIVVDRNLDAVFSVDLASGDRTIVSDAVTGTGPAFSAPESVVYDAAGNRALVMDWAIDALVGVDLVSGNRTVISDNAGIGTGETFSVPFDLELDAGNGRVLVSDYGRNMVFAVDLVTGNRTVLASSVSTPLEIRRPYYVTLDSDNRRIFVYDLVRHALVVMDLESGEIAVAAK